MSCHRIDEFIDTVSHGKTAALPADVAGHLEQCEACRRLFQLLQTETEPSEVPIRTRDRILRQLTDSLKAVSPVPSAGAITLVLIGAFFLMSILPIGMMGAPSLAAMSLAQLLAPMAIIGVGVVLLAVSLSRQVIPASHHPIAPKPLIVCFLGVFLCSIALLFPWRDTDAFLARGIRCSTAGILVAIPAAATAWIILRRGAVLHAGALGASLGLFAGLAGVTVLQFNCLYLEAKHILVWHTGMAIFSTAAGFLAGECFRRPWPGRA